MKKLIAALLALSLLLSGLCALAESEPTAFEEAGIAVPEGCIWNQEGGYVTKEGDAFVGKMYDLDSGWMIGTEDGAYYDAWYGWQYDGDSNELVDLATGNRYDLEYNPVSVAAE